MGNYKLPHITARLNGVEVQAEGKGFLNWNVWLIM